MSRWSRADAEVQISAAQLGLRAGLGPIVLRVSEALGRRPHVELLGPSDEFVAVVDQGPIMTMAKLEAGPAPAPLIRGDRPQGPSGFGSSRSMVRVRMDCVNVEGVSV